MTRLSNSIILPEVGSATTPASGGLTLFAKSSDSRLYYKNDAGVEYGPLDAYTAPLNMVTTDTVQTITGNKTFSGTLTGTSITASAGIFDGTDRVYSKSNEMWQIRNDAALARAREMVATTSTQAVDFWFIGDSITEGYYASSFDNAYPSLIRDKVQKWFNPASVPGGINHIAPHTTGMGGSPADPIVYNGSVTLPVPNAETNGGRGLNSRYVALDAASESATLTFFGDRVHILFSRYSGGGTFSWSIDGGAETNVSTNNAVDSSGLLVFGGALTRGTHTITVTYVSGSTVYIDGFLVCDGDTSAGIRVWNGGHSGFQAGQQNSLSTHFANYLNSAGSPDLVTICYGANDVLGGVTPATFQTELQNMIDTIRSLGSGVTTSILIMMLPKRGSTTDVTWKTYIDAAEAAALSRSVGFLDLSKKIIAPPSSGSANLWQDSVHPNDAGHQAIADEWLRAVFPTESAKRRRDLYAPVLGSTGLPGAPAFTRWAGGTTSGAPTSGTFALGDFVIAQNAHMWVCTTAGSPGIWSDVGVASNMVTTDTNQTISGIKTFSVAPLFPAASVTLANLSTTGTADGTTYLRGDGVWSTVTAAPPSNMVTTDTVQAILANKTIRTSGIPVFSLEGTTSATGTIAQSFGRAQGVIDAWVGTVGTTKFFTNDTAGDFAIRANTGTGSVNIGFGTSNTNAAALRINSTGVSTGTGIPLYENGVRVYSASNTPPYPVTTVATRTGAVTLTAADVGAGTFPAGTFTFQTNLIFNNGTSVYFTMSSGSSGYIGSNGTTVRARGGSSGFVFRDNNDSNSIMTLSDSGALNTTGNITENGTRVYSVNNPPSYPVTSVNGRTAAVTGLAEANAVVDLTTGQTIAGVKTFSSAPVVPDGSFGILKISATGTPSSTTYLRGDGTWSTISAAILSGTQAFTGQNSFNYNPATGPAVILNPQTASGGTPRTNSANLRFVTNYYNSGEFTESIEIQARGNSGAAGSYLNISGELRAITYTPSGLSGAQSVTRWAGGTNTGAPTFGNFATGDLVIARDGFVWICTTGGSPGTWASPGGAPSNMATTDTSQTISGVKTFGSGKLLMSSAIASSVEPYSDANPPETLNQTKLAAAPSTPASGYTVQYTLTTDNRPYIKNDSGEVFSLANVEPYIMSVTGALTVATGKSRVYLEGNYVIESIRASVNTAPTGASILVDVNLNGTTIYGTQSNRPTITAGSNTGLGGAPTSTAVTSGQYLTVDVDQIGSTVAGSDLTVVIRLRRVA